MKTKRVLGGLLALFMVFAMLSASVFADTEDLADLSSVTEVVEESTENPIEEPEEKTSSTDGAATLAAMASALALPAASSAPIYTFRHIDLRVAGSTYTVTLDGTPYTIHAKLYDADMAGAYPMTVTDPTGVLHTLELQDLGSQENEYRVLGLNLSSIWDNAEGYKEFTINCTLQLTTIDVEAIPRYEQIFAAYYVAGIGYLFPVIDYHPTANVCIGSGNSRGYDFQVHLSETLSYLDDVVIVEKYVLDEDGNELIGDTTSFEFTLSKAGETLGTTDMKTGESDTFDGLEPGYYSITETGVDGYIPVEVDGDGDLIPSGLVQYVQSTHKADNEIATVTFYNMKEDKTGRLIISKIEEGKTSGTHDYFFNIYDSDGELIAERVKVEAGGSAELYGLVPGSYTVVELDPSDSDYTLVVSVSDGVFTVDSYGNYETSPVTVVEKQATEITFKNVYTLIPTDPIAVSVAKGSNDEDDGRTFQFCLYAVVNGELAAEPFYTFNPVAIGGLDTSTETWLPDGSLVAILETAASADKVGTVRMTSFLINGEAPLEVGINEIGDYAIFALAGSSTIAVTADNNYTALPPQKVPSVHLSKTSSGSAEINRPVSYRLTVTNNGNDALGNFTLSDTMLGSATNIQVTKGGVLVANTEYAISGQTIIFNSMTLAVGESFVVTYQVTFSAPGNYFNQAVVNALGQASEVSVKDNADVAVTVTNGGGGDDPDDNRRGSEDDSSTSVISDNTPPLAEPPPVLIPEPEVPLADFALYRRH